LFLNSFANSRGYSSYVYKACNTFISSSGCNSSTSVRMAYEKNGAANTIKGTLNRRYVLVERIQTILY
jgi:hypothetical protein